MAESLVWFDYETFGLDPARDRPAQFAGLRTNLDLDPLGDPLTLFCQPPRDYLPNPESCVLTGISPIEAMERGVPEYEFINRIHGEFSVPGSCGVGFNNIRFDDEVTRNALYRNLRDPFAREWQNGNSRWDLLNVVRMARALRPQGVIWPKDHEGRPTLKLDHLTVANGIPHQDAHDAMGDVRATLALARLLKSEQPRLFKYLWELRLKRSVLSMVSPGSLEPFLMASTKMSAETLNLGIVVVVGRQPENPNALIIYDLCHPPEIWIEGEPSDEEGHFGPFSLLHVNRAPALAPLSVLKPEDEARLGLDLECHLKHLKALIQLPYQKAPGYVALTKPFDSAGVLDADLGLYGGFASDRDRQRLDEFREPNTAGFLQPPARFDNERYRELCVRFKARNFPETLNVDERESWATFCRSKWFDKSFDASMSVEEFNLKVDALKQQYASNPSKTAVIEATERYVRELTAPSLLA